MEGDLGLLLFPTSLKVFCWKCSCPLLRAGNQSTSSSLQVISSHIFFNHFLTCATLNKVLPLLGGTAAPAQLCCPSLAVWIMSSSALSAVWVVLNCLVLFLLYSGMLIQQNTFLDPLVGKSLRSQHKLKIPPEEFSEAAQKSSTIMLALSHTMMCFFKHMMLALPFCRLLVQAYLRNPAVF